MKLETRDFLIIIGIMTLVTFASQLLEVILDGKIIESKAEDIVITGLSFSLFYNLKKFNIR